MAWLVKNQGLADIHLFVPEVMRGRSRNLSVSDGHPLGYQTKGANSFNQVGPTGQLVACWHPPGGSPCRYESGCL
jgi:hypothetical protein